VRIVTSPAAPPREPPVYRPLGLLAFAAAIVGGTPIGLRLLAWLYLGAPAPGPEWRLLHAHVQVFGFFATLIPGVAQHLMPRFTGQPVVRRRIVPLLTAAFAIALVLRAVGTASESAAPLVVAAGLQTAGFLAFAWQVWRMLAPPPLALLRWQLTGATVAFALAMGAETVARSQALAAGLTVPSDAWMRAIHAVGLYAVLGWVLGVLLRAGPMFVPGWGVALPLARGVAVALALAAAAAVVAEAVDWPTTATTLALSRAGDVLALVAVVAVALGAGAFRRVGATLPVIGRSGPESRIFRLAVVCAVAAFVGFLATAVLAASGMPVHLLTDAFRHLLTVGFVTSVVVAMTFRLIPVLEGVALPWPCLRAVALSSLIAAVVVRTAQVPIAYLAPSLAPVVALSGVLVWIALVSVGANLVAAIARRRPETIPSPPDRIR
jgi:hypothetical protein